MKKRRSTSISKNKKDFSNRAIIIFLILLVVVSIISIGFYMHTLTNVKPKFVVNEGKSAGEVLITITKAPSETNMQQSDQSGTNLNTQS